MTFFIRRKCNDVSVLQQYIKQGMLIATLGTFITLPTTSIWGQTTQNTTKSKPARILFLVDGSSSMLYNWKANETRNKVASRIISDLCDSIIAVNNDVSFGIRAYGTQYPSQQKNCTDTRLEMPFTNANNIHLLKHKATQIRAFGYSPIAYSLQVAAEQDFQYSDDYSYSIILITDGGESCGGDICKVMETLINKKIAFKPYIISLLNDQMLEHQFQCMGEYLSVTNDDEIKTAITKIIGDNRKILEIKSTPPAPTPKVVQPAIITEKPRTISPIEPIHSPIKIASKKTTFTTHIPVKKRTVPFFKYTSEVLEDEPTKIPFVAVESIVSKNTVNKRIVKYSKPPAPTKIKVPYFKYSSTILEDEPVKIAFISVEAVVSKTTLQKSVVKKPNFNIYHKVKVPYFKYTSTPIPIDVPAVVVTNPAPKTPVTTTPNPKPVVTTPAVVTKNDPPKNTRPQPVVDENKPYLETAIDYKDSEKTNLIVRFVSRTGKQYMTMPMLNITNISTKEVIKKNRLVSNNVITPIELKPGKYDISLGNKKQYAKSVEILPNKDNIVTILIEPSTISFYYQTNKNRPVKEYRAYISKRFDTDREVTTQECTEKLYYDPANYHIEINTLPPTVYNMDLEVNTHKVVALSEPGNIQIMNTNNMGRIEFWYRLGTTNRFFYAMNINGNTAEQYAEFMPGQYEIRYQKNPNDQRLTIIPVSIKSNNTTNITLE